MATPNCVGLPAITVRSDAAPKELASVIVLPAVWLIDPAVSRTVSFSRRSRSRS